MPEISHSLTVTCQDEGAPGKDAVNFFVSGTEIVFKKNGKTQFAQVKATATRSSENLGISPSQLDGHSTSDSLAQLTAGVKASYGLPANGIMYNFMYDGSTDVDFTVGFTLKADGETCKGNIHILTVADGEKGDKGDTGHRSVPRIRYWDEVGSASSQPPYTNTAWIFKGTAPDEPYSDIVIDRATGQYYQCVANYWKRITPQVTPAQLVTSGYLRTAAPYQFIATDLLLATLAKIKNLYTDIFRMTDDEGNIVVQIADGDATFRTGTFSNVRILAGDGSGNRIEIDPVSGSISVYDDSGAEVARFSGERTNSSTELFNSQTGSLNVSNTSGKGRGSETLTSPSSGFQTEKRPADTIYLGDAVQSTAPATVSVKAWLKTTATAGTDMSVSNGMIVRAMANASISLYIFSYSDAGCTKLIGTKLIGRCYTNKTWSKEEASVTVPKGYHRLGITYVMEVSGAGSSAMVEWGGTSASNPITAKFLTNSYQTVIYRSGMLLGKNPENYATIYCHGDDQMRFFLLNNDYGIDISQYGIRHRFKGSSKWQTLPQMLFRGIFNTGNTTANAPFGNRLGLDYDDQVTYTRLGTGAVQVKFSAAMQSALGLTNANAKTLLSIRATPYGGDTVTITNGKPSCLLNKATLANIKAAGFVVMLADDDSANDGECLLEISMTGYPVDGANLVPATEI